MICTSSGCAVSASPRTNSRADRSFRPAVVVSFEVKWNALKNYSSGVRRRRPQPPNAVANLDGVLEERSDRDEAHELVPLDCTEPRGCETAAVAAVGRTAKLAGRDLGCEVGGDRGCHPREHTLIRRTGRLRINGE